MYRAHFMEFKYEDRDKVFAIFGKYLNLGWFDDFRIYEDTVQGVKRLRLKLHPYVSDDLKIMEDDFRKAGIELF